MMEPLRFAYGQARIQARLAALPAESDWQRLGGARGLGPYLEEARVGPLGPWLKGFSALSGPHELERGIRLLAWEHAHAVAAWVPRAWGPAVEWLAWIPFLAAFEELSRARRLPPWAPQDPRLRELLEGDGSPTALAPRRGGAAQLGAPADAEPVTTRWLEEWRRRWPTVRGSATGPLESFARELRVHLAAFRAAGPETAWDLRHQLRDRLRLRLHQRLLQPLAAFLYLALVLLDLERLRGELLRRCLFGPAALGAGQGGGAA
jgi:hypothetical protein